MLTCSSTSQQARTLELPIFDRSKVFKKERRDNHGIIRKSIFLKRRRSLISGKSISTSSLIETASCFSVSIVGLDSSPFDMEDGGRDAKCL